MVVRGRPRQQTHQREQVSNDEIRNDQSNQPSLDHDKSAEPTELDARKASDEFANPTRPACDPISFRPRPPL
jgi:hypothetical protein